MAATQVQIVTNKKNVYAQQARAALSMSLACSKVEDADGLRTALKQLDNAIEHLKLVII